MHRAYHRRIDTTDSSQPRAPSVGRPFALIGLIALAALAVRVRSLHDGPVVDRVAGIAIAFLGAVAYIGHSGSRRHDVSRRWRILTILGYLYALWWPTLFVALATHRGSGVSAPDLLSAAFVFGGVADLAGDLATVALTTWALICAIVELSPGLSRMTLGLADRWSGPPPAASTTRWRRIASHSWIWSAPGLVLFSNSALDLVARQHVERVVRDAKGVAVSLTGPLLTTFLWSAIIACSLGVVLTVGWRTLDSRLTTENWSPPTYAHLFAGTVSFAFVVRLVTLLTVAPVRTDGGDPLFYHTTANLLARGLGFPEPLNFIAYQDFIPSALHGPLYPVVLSASSRLGGTTWFDHKILSLLIGTAVVALVGLVARRVAPREHARSVSIIAMLLAAAYPNLWLVDGVMFPEGLMAVCTTATVYAAYRWRDSTAQRWAVAMGLLVGLSALARGEGLLLSVLLIVPWILLRRELPVRQRFRHITLAAVACILVLAPWAVRNARSFETFVPLSTNGNELFVYANCDETYSGKFLGFWLFQCQEDLRAAGLDAVGDEAEKSIYWRNKGFEHARDNLSDLPKVIAARVGRQWELFRPWQNADFAEIEGRDKGAARAGLFMYYGLAATSLYGGILIRRRRAGLLPLGSLFVMVTLTAAYAYGTTRFRVPAEPALCVLSAVGLHPLLLRLRHRWRRRPENDFDHPVGTHFVTGAAVDVRRAWSRVARRSWLSIATVLGSVAVTLPALYRATGSTMEEGFMLTFPERVMRGDVANVDFLHLYGPGSLHLLAGWYRLFDVGLPAERTFGLLQHLSIILGLVVLTRPWGRTVSTAVGVAATVFVLTPIGLQALAWNGAVGLGLWAIVFASRAHHREAAGADPGPTWIAAGVLAGLALTFRPDLALALGLVAVFVLRRRTARTVRRVAAGFAVGLTSIWVHLVQAGPAALVRGVFLDPVFKLRGGRELPRPPSLDRLDGALQVIGEKFGPWWGLPHLGAPKQLFLWFFLLPIVAVFVLAVGVRSLRRRRPTGYPLMVGALFGVGLLPQAVQRPDSAHFLWVSCISWPLLMVAIAEVVRMREPRSHPHARFALAAATLAALTLIVTPFYTLRTYVDLARRSITSDTPVLEVNRNGRYFYLGDTRPWLAAREVVADLDELARPGERLVVGPVDLRQTAYSDVMFYYLFPELTPATYFIEMDPGIANTEGSRLADDVASADWLILTRFWSGWIEPNSSTVFGPDEPNQVVEAGFCLVDSYQHDVLRLYRSCPEGDSVGPYDPPYDPRHDYAVEVRVPVPPRPDGTCTPTCNGQFDPAYADIDTSVIQ